MTPDLLDRAAASFRKHFDVAHTVAAYAPGRVEVLGNHTDYNEGFVLSAAIQFGTCFLVAPSADATVRIVAGDIDAEAAVDLANPAPDPAQTWANYVIGVMAGLHAHGAMPHGFSGLLLGDVPLGAGLSSSAALEMSAGLAIAGLYGLDVDDLAMAKIGQAAEHVFAGMKCGLLDQVSSLHGKPNQLIMTDFRTLAVENVPLGEDTCFLMCNTHAKHALVDGEYNERRAKCEAATAYFAGALDHDVQALRDVSWDEWRAHAENMDPLAAKRSAHVVGENHRVLEGRTLLADGRLEAFGKLMFESHHSSREYFENSAPELDALVDAAQQIPAVLGARLSGGGFGGSVVALVRPADVDRVIPALTDAYAAAFDHPCDIRTITPSDGARVL